MKKKTDKKLTVKKETVRKLTDADLKRVAGGAGTTRKDCPCIHTSAGPSHPIFC